MRETVAMTARDGVRLEADVWRPAGGGRHPVLLMRQPYGRAIAATVVYAHPSWYARHGYIVAVQDVRGRGSSAGPFDLFAQEIADGADALEWAANLPGSTGAVGMYGFSYQGMTQWFAAASRHPALKAIAPAMAAWDVRADMAYENGALRLAGALYWGLQMAAENARIVGDSAAHAALVDATRALPLGGPTPAWPAVMERFGAYSHYADWLDRPASDPYWARISPGAHAAAVDLPALHVGGWFDFMLTGTLGGWRAMLGKRSPQLLVIGPWSHMPWVSRVGDADFGPSAASAIDVLQLRWFDHWLKGVDSGVLAEPSVRLFEMGGNRWRSFEGWPKHQAMSLHLASSGRAAVDIADGCLLAAVPDAEMDCVVMDPFRPTPSAGGHAGTPGGAVDRSAVDLRPDVMTFTSAPLDRDLHLAGAVNVELFCDCDQPSFDVSATLSEVGRDGRAMVLATAHARCAPGPQPFRLELRTICARVAGGNALRLSLAAAAFPAYELNPGNGASGRAARLIDQRITTLTVRHGGATPSRLILPAVAP